jgi:hypothetical protein
MLPPLIVGIGFCEISMVREVLCCKREKKRSGAFDLQPGVLHRLRRVGSEVNIVGILEGAWNGWTRNATGFRRREGAMEPDQNKSRSQGGRLVHQLLEPNF